MTTKAHSLLTGSDLHEPKGVATATVGQIYAADGSGSGAWKKLDASNLSGLANPFGASLLHVREQYVSGVFGSTSFVAGAFPRTLNTVKTNEITSAVLSSNQISLPAGTYYAEAHMAGVITLTNSVTASFNQCFLFDATHSAVLVPGTSANFPGLVTSGSFQMSMPVSTMLSGRFTLASTSSLQFWHFTTSGIQSYPSGSGTNEVYSDVLIWKIST